MERPTSEDPRKVLGVAPGADDAAIRAAYLRLVRQFPPESGGSHFERIRDAYDVLRNPRRRASEVVTGGRLDSLTELVDRLPVARRFVGPEPWLAVLRARKPRP